MCGALWALLDDKCDMNRKHYYLCFIMCQLYVLGHNRPFFQMCSNKPQKMHCQNI